MEFMLDTVNIEKIQYFQSIFPISGVTSNPTILKNEGKIDLFSHFKKIQTIIGQNSLHVQVVGETVESIISDAETIVGELGMETYIKIPITIDGLAAIKKLKARGFKITATAIYSEFQGYLAIAAGVDYLAPYYNRMENLNIDAGLMIESLVSEIARTQSSSKVLAASFKNVAQVNEACRKGAQSVTVGLEIFEQAFMMPSIEKAVTDFHEDWRQTFSTETIKEYLNT
ncbi:MAG: fructose-6-phosphate aldolase [Enterococcus lemanii]